MNLYLHIANLVLILLFKQTCLVESDGIGQPSASSIRLNFEIDVPDPQIKMKISQLFNADKKEVRKAKLRSSSEPDIAGEIIKSVFGIFERLVNPIADAIDQKLADDWIKYIGQLNRTRDEAEKEFSSGEQYFKAAMEAFDAVDQLFESKNVCRKKCDAWCSAMECRTPNCPDVPSDVKKCAKLPLCQPYWRCNLGVVGKESNSSIHGGGNSRSSLRSYKSLGKAPRKKSEKSSKKVKVKRVKRSTGKIEGAARCGEVLKELDSKRLLRKGIAEEFFETVKDFSKRVKKGKHPEAKKSMCEVLKFYGENSPCEGSSDESMDSKVIEDGVAAIFYHAFLEKKSTEYDGETKRFKRISCPPCKLHCPHLLLLNCSYTCPNRPDCNSYMCNCI